MPIHDWTRVDAGLFHAFHQEWTCALANVLNSGRLPPGYFSLLEQQPRLPPLDFFTLDLSPDGGKGTQGIEGLSGEQGPPRAHFIQRCEGDPYPGLANLVTIRNSHGEVVAVVDILSPGNKGSRYELRAFVRKMVRLIQHKVHALVIDLFPPTKGAPQGFHKAIWDELDEQPFELPPDKPLLLAAYDAGEDVTAYVEPVAVGDALPDMPLFLQPGIYVPAPLEATYQETWRLFPAPMKKLLEGPAPPAQ